MAPFRSPKDGSITWAVRPGGETVNPISTKAALLYRRMGRHYSNLIPSKCKEASEYLVLSEASLNISSSSIANLLPLTPVLYG